MNVMHQRLNIYNLVGTNGLVYQVPHGSRMVVGETSASRIEDDFFHFCTACIPVNACTYRHTQYRNNFS